MWEAQNRGSHNAGLELPRQLGRARMAIQHAQHGDVIDVRPLADRLASSRTITLIKTAHLEVIRMILPAGKMLPEHKAHGEIIVQCLEGDITFTTMGEPKRLRAGDMLYLAAGEPHELVAVEDSSFLLTIMRPAASQQS